jgi:hypothetical protein
MSRKVKEKALYILGSIVCPLLIVWAVAVDIANAYFPRPLNFPLGIGVLALFAMIIADRALELMKE